MIVLDTHAWLWWLSEPEKIPAATRSILERSAATASVGVSSVSTWEAALLVKKGRLVLSMDVQDWVRKSEALPFLRFWPVDNSIALRSVHLPEPFHDDPADRIIVATALQLDATVVTRDEKIRNYGAVRSIW